MKNINNGELVLGNNLSNKFIEKMIEDTKSNKLVWDISAINSNGEKYCAEIDGIGKVTIERDILDYDYDIVDNKALRRFLGLSSIFSKTSSSTSSVTKETLTLQIGEDLEIYVDAKRNRDYYVNLKRLYNLAQHFYLEKQSALPQNANLTQAITAYINAD